MNSVHSPSAVVAPSAQAVAAVATALDVDVASVHSDCPFVVAVAVHCFVAHCSVVVRLAVHSIGSPLRSVCYGLVDSVAAAAVAVAFGCAAVAPVVAQPAPLAALAVQPAALAVLAEPAVERPVAPAPALAPALAGATPAPPVLLCDSVGCCCSAVMASAPVSSW